MKKQKSQAHHPHSFKLNKSKSYKKGDMRPTKNGLLLIADKNCYLYECKRCDSAIEMDGIVPDVRSLNEQLAERYSCV